MSIKSDKWIKRMALEHKIIEPFVDEQMRSGVISYGLSSYGYDIRVADEFKVFTNVYNTVVDPKCFDPKSFVDIKADVCIIPPNSFAQTEGFTALKENTLIENFQPHFHLRGKSMQVEAILPDGSSRILSYVGNFNFNWMANYIYDDDAAPLLPKGTVIHVSAWYDNTKANKNNPDPEQWVGFGDRTVDEMAHAWMNVVYLSDEEYQKMLTDRKTKMTKVNTDQNLQ